jgi:phosphate transport system substrate-binding protein
MTFLKIAVSTLTAVSLSASFAFARDNVHAAGSSTVLPYAAIVAEAFGENFDFPTPLIESGGSGAGRKKMCEGVGANTTDIANSSSRIKQSDIDNCASNGVTDIMEVRIGYDGIVFASRLETKGFENLTPMHIYLAASDKSNASNWQAIDPAMPDREIMLFIPGTKHGTREVFEEKVMLAGCKKAGSYDLFFKQNGGDKKKAEKECFKVRTDGRSVDIDGDYTETLARLASNPNGIGVFGLSFLLNNTDTIYAAKINGIEASTETIASGVYPVSRPLYFYVKMQHLGVIPGLQEYVDFFVSDEIAGPDGPLSEYGLVSDPELAATQSMVANGGTKMGPLN